MPKRRKLARQRRSDHRGRHGRWRVRGTMMALAVVSLGSLSSVRAQPSDVPSSPPAAQSGSESRAHRWKESFDAFADEDRRRALPPGGVLFVGSSSIRLWHGIEKDFEALPVVIQRGFGGSRLSDCSEHVARLVLPYQPRLVIVYAGDNDLAEGAAPEDVLASFDRFVESVRKELPQTRIAYISIKPSPLRAALIHKAHVANDLIRSYVKRGANLDFIDIYTKMLGPDGRPKPQLFLPDMLHLNRDGYALWRSEIARHIPRELSAAAGGATAKAAAGGGRASP